jgi:hypothetical protein
MSSTNELLENIAKMALETLQKEPIPGDLCDAKQRRKAEEFLELFRNPPCEEDEEILKLRFLEELYERIDSIRTQTEMFISNLQLQTSNDLLGSLEELLDSLENLLTDIELDILPDVKNDVESNKKISLKEIQNWAKDQRSLKISENQTVLNEILRELFQALHIRFEQDDLMLNCSNCDLTGTYTNKVHIFSGFSNGIDRLVCCVDEQYAGHFQRIWGKLKLFEHIFSLAPLYRGLMPNDVEPGIRFKVTQKNGSIQSGWKFVVFEGKFVFERFPQGLAILCEGPDGKSKIVPISLLQE